MITAHFKSVLNGGNTTPNSLSKRYCSVRASYIVCIPPGRNLIVRSIESELAIVVNCIVSFFLQDFFLKIYNLPTSRT